MVSLPVCEITDDAGKARSGSYFVTASGNPVSSVSSFSDYKISEVNIPVVEKMKLSFLKNTINELGRYVTIDLQFGSGKLLSQLSAYRDQNDNTMDPATGRGTIGAGYEQFVCEIGKGELIGDRIAAISVCGTLAVSKVMSARLPPVRCSTWRRTSRLRFAST